MPRPRIGITTDYVEPRTAYKCYYEYAAAVEKAGGLPLLIPHRVDLSLVPQIVDSFDGILFSGGDDLDPASYGEEFGEGTEPIDAHRERFERALLAEVEKRRTPVLGVCLGSQLMNVYRGGSLIQFLPEEKRDNPIEHRKLGDPKRSHDVRLDPESLLSRHLKATQIVVNTSHKQSVRKLGKGLRVIATSPDGVIEGTEDPTLPLFMGVQWHPERILHQPEQLAIFQLLVEKSRA